MNVKRLSLFGGLGTAVVLLTGNISNAFAEKAVKVATPAEQVEAQRIAAIDVPYGDKRDKNLPADHWDEYVEMATARRESIIFLYSDASGLAANDDPVYQELKAAAQHLIADPNIPFFRYYLC